MKFNPHKKPAERTRLEKLARRFILPEPSVTGLTFEAWDRRDAKLKRLYPIRWFVWETAADWLRYNIRGRYKRARDWMRFRTVDRYHILKLEMEPGYCDPDVRLLEANFQILKDFVEIELASMHLASHPDTHPAGARKVNMLSTFGKLFRKNRRRNIRDPQAGLAHLDWEIDETSGNQQECAKVQKELYLWWTVYRKERINSYDHPLTRDPKSEKTTFKLAADLEKFYEAEDEAMLLMLVRIRRSLWT